MFPDIVNLQLGYFYQTTCRVNQNIIHTLTHTYTYAHINRIRHYTHTHKYLTIPTHLPIDTGTKTAKTKTINLSTNYFVGFVLVCSSKSL